MCVFVCVYVCLEAWHLVFIKFTTPLITLIDSTPGLSFNLIFVVAATDEIVVVRHANSGVGVPVGEWGGGGGGRS